MHKLRNWKIICKREKQKKKKKCPKNYVCIWDTNKNKPFRTRPFIIEALMVIICLQFSMLFFASNSSYRSFSKAKVISRFNSFLCWLRIFSTLCIRYKFHESKRPEIATNYNIDRLYGKKKLFFISSLFYFPICHINARHIGHIWLNWEIGPLNISFAHVHLIIKTKEFIRKLTKCKNISHSNSWNNTEACIPCPMFRF